MKKIKEYARSDKGSITTVVVVTVLFFVIVLSTAYMVTATLRKSQLKSEITAKEIYEKDFNHIDEIKDSLKTHKVKIPEGFYYVGGTIDSGLVISDDPDDENAYQDQTVVGTNLKGNQFVWIPVDYSNFHLIEGFQNGSKQSYLSPSREAGSADTAGTAESKAMYKSVQDNHGFYIARYEAGINGTTENGNLVNRPVTNGTVPPLSKAGLGVWNNIAWGSSSSTIGLDGLPGSDIADGAVKVARSMYPNTEKLAEYGLPTNLTNNTGVVSTLCYGVQWDAIMQFIDSSYVTGTCPDDSFVKNSTEEWTSEVSGSARHTTGYHAVKNIYDLGGNVIEWTMEASDSNDRVSRGGVYNRSGSENPASCRSNIFPDNSYDSAIGFRVALYL